MIVDQIAEARQEIKNLNDSRVERIHNLIDGFDDNQTATVVAYGLSMMQDHYAFAAIYEGLSETDLEELAAGIEDGDHK